MKKSKQRIFMALSMLLMPSFALSAPVGNIAPMYDMDETGWSATLEYDTVLERKLDDGSEMEMDTVSVRLTYMLGEMAEIYAILGAGTIDEDSTGFESDTDFAWGLGATFALYEFDNDMRLGMDISYRMLDTEGNYSAFPGVDVDTEYSEWQVALGLAKDYEWGTPYIGVKYNDVNLELSAPGISGDGNSDDVIGLFVGADFLIYEYFTVGIEGRFLDEEAFYIYAEYDF